MLLHALLAIGYLQGQAPAPQVWEKRPAPGILYRMIVEPDPVRITVALRFDRNARQYWATSSIANDEVYDLKPANGRAKLSQMVADAGAIGGVNGDFFQWGNDPGGDPVGLMVRNGELLSHPGGKGDRAPSIGWGRGGVLIADRATWKAEAEFTAARIRVPIEGLNEYARDEMVTLATPSAGYAISKGPSFSLLLKAEPGVLRPTGEWRAEVVGSRENVEKIPVPPGMLVLTGRGGAAERLRLVPMGADMVVRTETTGYDFRQIDNVMGGGPVLLRKGQPTRRAAEDQRHPRTAMGIDAEGNVWYAVIDGRQTMSVGATLRETAEVMRRLGCVDAINLDGGGSSSIQLFGMTLNRPSGGVERDIANGILWHGPLPVRSQLLARLIAPESLAVGQSARLRLDGVSGPTDAVIWSCQGGAWVDGEGTVRAIKEGEAIVRALVGGDVIETKLRVTKAE